MSNNKKIYDKGIVFTGLVIFLALITFPFWYNRGIAAPAPEPELTEKAKAAKECVLPADEMKTGHMQLLNDWRNDVVRNADRMYVNEHGKEFNMSLSNECLDCHSSKEDFCDRCHNYASVKPYCWDCHIDNPKEKM
ncbi:MAG: sulfate reduction electron transfer complex DsrMKJOP subunit DsrJ [Desulfobacterales bacterium]|nr:sulfate reduction electron transfer complex DsrMKJOP subunit DsrJ [Desulfobacterales bacterium]